MTRESTPLFPFLDRRGLQTIMGFTDIRATDSYKHWFIQDVRRSFWVFWTSKRRASHNEQSNQIFGELDTMYSIAVQPRFIAVVPATDEQRNSSKPARVNRNSTGTLDAFVKKLERKFKETQRCNLWQAAHSYNAQLFNWAPRIHS